MKDQEEFDNNLFIKEVAEQFVKDPSEENFLQVVAELIVRINDEGTVPTVMMNELHIEFGFDPDIETDKVFAGDKKIGNRMAIFVTDDRCKWLPLFSTVEEIHDVPETNAIADVPIRTILENACDEEEIDGILINPFTDSIALRKEALVFILDNADGQFRHAC